MKSNASQGVGWWCGARQGAGPVSHPAHLWQEGLCILHRLHSSGTMSEAMPIHKPILTSQHCPMRMPHTPDVLVLPIVAYWDGTPLCVLRAGPEPCDQKSCYSTFLCRP